MTITEKLPFAEEAFDPTLFGFDTSFNKKGSRIGSVKKACDKDFILFSSGENEKETHVTLSLSESTAEFVIELFGDRVDFAIDDKGRILIYEGKARRVSKRPKSERRTIAIGAAHDELQRIHGLVSKVYLKPKPYAKGKAILFTPTGEVD